MSDEASDDKVIDIEYEEVCHECGMCFLPSGTDDGLCPDCREQEMAWKKRAHLSAWIMAAAAITVALFKIFF